MPKQLESTGIRTIRKNVIRPAMSRWSPYVPSANAPWHLARVVHLHRRAGFAATWPELQRDLADGPELAVSRLLNGTSRSEGVPENFEAMELFRLGIGHYSEHDIRETARALTPLRRCQAGKPDLLPQLGATQQCHDRRQLFLTQVSICQLVPEDL